MTQTTAVDYEVIDGDGHIVLPEGWWQPYLPKKYWDWAPRGRRAEGREIPPPLPMAPRAGVYYQGGDDPHARLRAMDEDGVATAYLYPSQVLSLMPALKSASFALALEQAYNDWLLDYCAADPYRLRPVALVPQQDLILAVEELERVARRGVSTIMVRPNPVLGVTIDDPNYDRLWAAAQDLGVVVAVHEGFGWPVPQAGVDRCKTFMQGHIVSHPFEHMLACLMLITGGVLERFPRLRVAFMESGAGWAPFWLNRMDEHWEKPQHETTLPDKPSVYFKRQCFLGVEPDDHLLPQMVDFGLEDCLVFASDFPHYDAIFPGSVAAALDRTDITDAVKRKLLRDNALRMYQIEQPMAAGR